jgi:membrane protein required for beta-lactamase induction
VYIPLKQHLIYVEKLYYLTVVNDYYFVYLTISFVSINSRSPNAISGISFLMYNLLHQISHDFISLTFITFVALYTIYSIIIQLHLRAYRQKYNSKPVHFKAFRLYSKSLISNSPSKKEKNFYIKTNKITYFFNALLVASCLVYVLICFR